VRLRAAAVLAGKLDWRRTRGSSLRLVSSLLHDGVVGSTWWRDTVRVSLRSRWVRAAVRAARHRPTANTTEIPPSTTLSDLLERVRLGQSKRATVNRAEPAPPSKLQIGRRSSQTKVDRLVSVCLVYASMGVPRPRERVIWGCNCIKPYQGPGPNTAYAPTTSHPQSRGNADARAFRDSTGTGMRPRSTEQVRPSCPHWFPVLDRAGVLP
jgi:hypothetical protein